MSPKGGKEDRQAEHIKQSEIARGKTPEEAERIAWSKVKHGKGGVGHKPSRSSSRGRGR